MLADIINDNINIRLITRNIMSVYSINKDYTDSIIRKLKHSNYKINNKNIVTSNKIISYIKKDYNIFENIFRYIKRSKHIITNKFIEYLNFLNLNHLLFLHFKDLNSEQLIIVETIMALSTNKPIIIINYIDDLEYKDKLYTLLFHVGLYNKLIIVPFTNIYDAVNNSTCQCYVKSCETIIVKQSFSNEFLNTEFNTSIKYYNGKRPHVYINNKIIPYISYKYSLHEIILILMFNIRMMLIILFNWRLKTL
jgi:hypothetical protein